MPYLGVDCLRMPSKRARPADILDRAELRRRRNELDLTQQQVADRAGMTGGKAQVSDIETGRSGGVTLDTLARLAAALDCEPADLLISRKGKTR
jgi:transcriptional regulator with XRE-family HTH domain